MIRYIVRMGTLYYRGHGAWTRDIAYAQYYVTYSSAYAVCRLVGGEVEQVKE